MKKIWIVFFSILLLCGCEKKESIYTVAADSGYKYEYQQLNEEQKKDYEIIYEAFMNMEEEIKLDSKSDDELYMLFERVMHDHPEIFWLEDYEYSQLETKIFGDYSFLYPTYLYTPEEVEDYKQQLDVKTQEILEPIAIDASDYEKVKYVYDYIIDHTSYVLDSADNQNIISVLLNGESVCAGYAKTMQYLLEKLGVSCAYLVGESATQYHAWNMVMMDGEYYYVDATYGDPTIDDREEEQKTYAYLGFTSSEMETLYVSDCPYEQSEANANNYYMKENAFIDNLDDQQFIEVITKEENLSARSFSFKCSNDDMYAQLKGYLLDQDEIFRLLNQLGIYVDGVLFIEDPEVHVITFSY